MMTRRCGICRQTGHDRRKCSHQHSRPLNRSSHEQICMLCEGRHNPYDCPILQDEPNIEYSEMEYLIDEYSDVDRVLPPPPPPPSPPSQTVKLNWDQCGHCGKPNHGKICSCGENMITAVACDENGFYDCTICYRQMKELNKVTTKCGHHFCIDCFLSHYTSNQGMSKKCPMCRANLVESEHVQPSSVPEQQPHQGIIRYIAEYIHNF